MVVLGDLLEHQLVRKKIKTNDLVTFIGMQDVSENAELINQKVMSLKQLKAGFTYFEKNDVLVAKITPCFENGKGAILLDLKTKVGFGSTEFHVLRARESNVAGYIFYITCSNFFRRKLESEMVGSAGHRRVPFQAVLNYRLQYQHSEAEQIAIAKALSDTDTWIQSLTSLIAKKRQIKQGAMQHLLTGKQRLPEFVKNNGYKSTEIGLIPEDWDCVLMGDIGQSLIGLTYSPNDVGDYGTLVLRSSNVQNGKLSFENNVFVNMELPKRVMVESGDILICVRNGSRQLIGKCAIIDESVKGAAFGAFMSVYRSKYSKFMFYQFQGSVIQKQIDETMGATINQITNKDLSLFKVALPRDEKEQTRIATILSNMDTEIIQLETKLTKAKTLKQGMMQNLLTGKIRLVEPQEVNCADA